MLDTTFNAGQPVLTPTTPTAATGLDAISAVAVQPDGKIVVVGAVDAISPAGASTLAVQRYNANGTLDTSFGTDGEVDITPPASVK